MGLDRKMKYPVDRGLPFGSAVEPIGDLVEVERQIPAADMVVLAVDRPLDNGPHALNRIGVRAAIDRVEQVVADELLRVATIPVIYQPSLGAKRPLKTSVSKPSSIL